MLTWWRGNLAALLVLVLSALLFAGAEVTTWRDTQTTCHAANDARRISNLRASVVRGSIVLAAREHPADREKWAALLAQVRDTPLRHC